MTATDALIGILQTVESATYDGTARDVTGRVITPDGPHIMLYGGVGTPTDLTMGYHHHATETVWQAVCVSFDPSSVRTLAASVVAAVDCTRTPLGILTIPYVSPPLEDRDDPSLWRWSSTVEITLTTRQGGH